MLHTNAFKGKPGPATDTVRVYRPGPEVFRILIVLGILEIEDGIVVYELVSGILLRFVETAAGNDETTFLQLPKPVGEDSSV